jgi:hypothetical protein
MTMGSDVYRIPWSWVGVPLIGVAASLTLQGCVPKVCVDSLQRDAAIAVYLEPDLESNGIEVSCGIELSTARKLVRIQVVNRSSSPVVINDADSSAFVSIGNGPDERLILQGVPQVRSQFDYHNRDNFPWSWRVLPPGEMATFVSGLPLDVVGDNGPVDYLLGASSRGIFSTRCAVSFWLHQPDGQGMPWEGGTYARSTPVMIGPTLTIVPKRD